MSTVRLLSEINYRISSSYRLRFVHAVFTADAAEREAIFVTSEERSDNAEELLDTLERRLAASPVDLANLQDLAACGTATSTRRTTFRVRLDGLHPSSPS